MTEPIDLDAALLRAREQVMVIASPVYEDDWPSVNAALDRLVRLAEMVGARRLLQIDLSKPELASMAQAEAEAIAREVQRNA